MNPMNFTIPQKLLCWIEKITTRIYKRALAQNLRKNRSELEIINLDA